MFFASFVEDLKEPVAIGAGQCVGIAIGADVALLESGKVLISSPFSKEKTVMLTYSLCARVLLTT